jgi:hypothetical protein
MIPEFDDNGYLPPGVHAASIEEVAVRFGEGSELRRAQMQSLRWLLDLARPAGLVRLVINGSFVTAALEPNDVDCALLTGPGFPLDRAVAEQIDAGLPFLQIDMVEQEDFDWIVNKWYATDRDNISKGMVEVML